MPFVYILRCADGSYYTGSTWDLERRLAEHELGLGANFTRRHLPVTLAWCAETGRIDDAFLWEKRIQGWTRAKKELLIEGRTDELAGWSARRRGSSVAERAERDEAAG